MKPAWLPEQFAGLGRTWAEWASRFWLLPGLLALMKLWLVSGQALTANPHFQHDDLLFLRLAEHLLAGRWLGPYDHLTLVKGPFYSLWIAFSFLLGLPLLLSQHLLYLAACGLLVWGLKHWLPARWLRQLLLASLIFLPSSYTAWVSARIIREGIYPALTLFVLGCGLGLAGVKSYHSRQALAWAVGLGLSLAAFWLAREEGIWLLPSLAALLLVSLSRLGMSAGSERRPAALHWLRAWGLVGLIWLLGVGLVCSLNWRAYGLFAKTEMDAPAFKAAYGALLRVQPARQAMSQETLQRIAAVSPALVEIHPYLAGEPGRSWALASTQSAEHFAGDAFQWALRDAVAAAGYYAQGRFPAEFYQRLASEINRACEQAELDCLGRRSGMAPPLLSAYWLPWVESFAEGLARFLSYDRFSAQPVPGSQAPALELFRDLTGEPLAGMSQPLQWGGWVVAEQGEVRLLLRSLYGSLPAAQLSWQASPDVFQYFSAQGLTLAQAQQARFLLQTACRPKECSLEAWQGGVAVAVFPLSQVVSGEAQQQNGVTLLVDDMRVVDLQPGRARLNTWKIAVLNQVGQVYRRLQPILAGLALGCYLLLAVKAWQSLRQPALSSELRWRSGLRWLLLSALLGAVFVRLAMLSLLRVTAFDALTLQYFSPAYPLLQTWLWLALCWTAEAWPVRKGETLA